MNKITILLTVLLLAVACNSNADKSAPKKAAPQKGETALTLYVQPYNGFDSIQAKQIGNDLKKNAKNYADVKIGKVIVLPNKKLTTAQMNKGKTRYRAEKILNIQLLGKKPNCAEIGLLNEDISTTRVNKKGDVINEDWGIWGLSRVGQRNSVVSTFRVKHKKDMGKLTLHEFTHGMGVHHCTSGDESCIMSDAKGTPKFGNKNKICDKCLKALKTNHKH